MIDLNSVDRDFVKLVIGNSKIIVYFSNIHFQKSMKWFYWQLVSLEQFYGYLLEKWIDSSVMIHWPKKKYTQADYFLVWIVLDEDG